MAVASGILVPQCQIYKPKPRVPDPEFMQDYAADQTKIGSTFGPIPGFSNVAPSSARLGTRFHP